MPVLGSRNAELHFWFSAVPAMSCRIERTVEGENSVVLRVSGRIQGENVDTLREAIEQEKGRLALDLTEILLVDREAVSLLAVSEANGIELRNCPAYIREWVGKERGFGYGE
jgi:hypothetical protein